MPQQEAGEPEQFFTHPHQNVGELRPPPTRRGEAASQQEAGEQFFTHPHQDVARHTDHAHTPGEVPTMMPRVSTPSTIIVPTGYGTGTGC